MLKICFILLLINILFYFPKNLWIWFIQLTVLQLNEKEHTIHLIVIMNVKDTIRNNQQHPFFFLPYLDYLWPAAVRLTLLLVIGLFWRYATGFLVYGSSFFLFPPQIAYESYLKNYFIFSPVLAETSIYVRPNYFSLDWATEAIFSYDSPFKSDLFPELIKAYRWP